MLRFSTALLALFLPLAVLAGDSSNAAAKTDIHGDELPPHAVARLGTMRFRHGGALSAVALSPDGKTLAISGGDDAIRLLETATGKERQALRGQTFQTGLIFSRDGKTLVTADSIGTLRLWDIAGGKEVRRFGVRRPPNTQPSRVSAMVWSPDERTLWAVDGMSVRQWLPVAGLELRTVNLAPAQALAVGISADGNTLYTAAADGTVRVWDVAKNQERRRFSLPAPRPTPGIANEGAVAFSPDARYVAVSDNPPDSSLKIFDTDNGKLVRSIATGVNRPVGLAFAPNGKALAATLSTGGAVIWGLASGQELRRFEIVSAFVQRGHLAFSADGKFLACGGIDQCVRLWDVPADAEIGALPGHQGGVQALAFAADGDLLVSGGTDRTLRLWNLADAKELSVFYRTMGFLHHLVPLPGKAFALASPEGLHGFNWDGKTLREAKNADGMRLSSNVMAHSPDHRFLAVGGPDNIQVVDVQSGKVARTFGKPGEAAGRVSALAFSPDGTLLATGGIDKPVQLWSMKTGRLVRSMPLPPNRRTTGQLLFTPDGNTLVSGDFEFHLWEVATGQERLQFNAGRIGTARSALFSPRGNVLVLGTHNGLIYLVDPLSGVELDQWSGHRGDVRCLALSPDGKKLASGSGDSTVLIWDAARLDDKTLREPIQLQAGEVELLWSLLGEPEGGRAYRAIAALAAAHAQSVPFIAKRLKPAEPIEAKDITKLVQDLNHAKFEARQKAFKDLERLGDVAEDALLEGLQGKPPLEMRRRLEQLVARLKSPSMEKVQIIRAVEVLEKSATPAACDVLATLARGAPGVWLTELAQRALDRARR